MLYPTMYFIIGFVLASIIIKLDKEFSEEFKDSEPIAAASLFMITLMTWPIIILFGILGSYIKWLRK